jgi:hypothetical protein
MRYTLPTLGKRVPLYVNPSNNNELSMSDGKGRVIFEGRGKMQKCSQQIASPCSTE